MTSTVLSLTTIRYSIVTDRVEWGAGERHYVAICVEIYAVVRVADERPRYNQRVVVTFHFNGVVISILD